jgi:hypothetical protein
MQEALAAAALALEEARAEARREMAAVVAVFGREIDELEVEFGEWREDAWGEAAQGCCLHTSSTATQTRTHGRMTQCRPLIKPPASPPPHSRYRTRAPSQLGDRALRSRGADAG